METPLRQLLFIVRDLVLAGYEDLRYYSFFKEGLGVLRFAIYFERAEKDENGYCLADEPSLIETFPSFDTHGCSGLFDSTDDGRTASNLAMRFESQYLFNRPKTPHPRVRDYLDWYAKAIDACCPDGFPITEDPSFPGFGIDGTQAQVVFKDASRAAIYIPRPPGFGTTRFPAREAEEKVIRKRLDEERHRTQKKYEEWQRRVRAIENNRKQ